MKKLSLGIVAIIILGAVFLLYKNQSDTKTVMPTSAATFPITVTTVEQNVSLRMKDASSDTAIPTSTTTPSNSVIKTSSTGRALIESPHGHPTMVDYNSEVVVSTSDDTTKNNIELLGGELWARAKKSAEQGEFFEIKTGNAVAVVRGTSFGVNFAGGITEVNVTEGEVFVYKKDPTTGEPIQGTETSVKAGFKAIIEDGKDIVVIPISGDDMKKEWYVYNNADAKPVVITSDATISVKPITTSTSTPRATTTTRNNSSITPPPVTPVPPRQSSGGGITSAPSPSAPASSGGTSGASTPTSIRSVTPSSIASGDNKTYVILKGTGFQNVSDVIIGENNVQDLSVIDDGTLQFHIGQLSPGTYDVYLLLKDDSTVSYKSGLTVTYSYGSYTTGY